MVIINNLGIYVHIPFCATKCPYCDFYSDKYNKQTETEYVNRVIWDILRWHNKGYTANTLYFGGGTPNLIAPENIGKIINAVKTSFNVNGEISIEANPRLITNEKMEQLAQYGVNRVSIGMQSAVPCELKALGRSHDINDIFNAVATVKAAGIENISLDMMLGVPYQTKSSTEITIQAIKNLNVTHVSAYILTVEENTPFYQSEVITHCPNEDETTEIYLNTVNKLDSIGLHQYEISNFCKEGFESQHNLKYWQCNNYLGFGAAAHSFFNNKRFCYINDIAEYIKQPKWLCTDKICDEYSEYIMLGLRLTRGINTDYLQSHFSIPKEKLLKIALPMQKSGLIKINQNNLSLTPRGFLVSNSIIAAFI